MEWFYKLARNVVWFLFTIWFDIEYQNTENIPEGRGGYICACNHTCYLDPLMIAFKQKPWIRFMAKGELYKLENDYCKALINKQLPYTIGGGIGQSRLCMFFLKKVHIGEVQASLWPEDMVKEMKDKNVILL